MKLSRIQFARLIGYIERAHALNMTSAEIEDLDDIIDVEVPEPAKIYPNTTDINALLVAMQHGKKIEAIKAYRNLTGTPLKDAKDAIEFYWDRKWPENLSTHSNGDLNATETSTQ